MPVCSDSSRWLGGCVATKIARQLVPQIARLTPARGEFSLSSIRSTRALLWLIPDALLAVILTLFLGCGQSGDVVQGELSEAARKSLIQKKVDVQDSARGKSRPGKQAPKTPAQRPSS